MKKRKLLAILLTLTMVMGSAITANAEENASTGSSTITGNGDVEYFPTDVYVVALPTDQGSFDLIVDPQGLIALEDGNSASLEDLKDGAGTISTENPTYVINGSSVDMKISMKLTLTAADATIVDAVEDVEDSTDKENNILLYAIPSSKAVSSEDDSIANATGYTAGSKGVVITNTATTVDFRVPAAEYEFSKTGSDYAYARNDEASTGIGVSFGGRVNTYADWEDYTDGTSTISLEAVFSFAPAESTDVLPETPVASYMISDGQDVDIIDVPASNAATDDYVMAKNDDGSVSYTFVDAPEGTVTALKVNGADKLAAFTKGNVTYAEGVLKFNATSVSGCGLATAGEHTIVVTFGSADPITLTYTAE